MELRDSNIIISNGIKRFKYIKIGDFYISNIIISNGIKRFKYYY